jgi:alanine racemase
MAFIKLNRENFYHNLNQIALKTGSIDKIAIVLKDNAYGHGLELMAKMASDFGIKHAVVRDEYEADKIRSLFDVTLILGGKITPLDRSTYAINSLEEIANIPKGTRVELKVDTGMHRNGIEISQLLESLDLIDQYELKLVGIMSHYRSADILSSELFWQQKQFDRVKKILQDRAVDIRIHSYNSATILRSKSFDEDLVRVGVAAYGYSELDDSFDTIDLKPVLSLYAKRVSSRVLKRSQRVGYGGSFIAKEDMVISTYDLGYGDGWCRGDHSRAYITSEGLPILGKVSMDLITLQSDRDIVCIMSNAQKAAKQFGTISYEMTTTLSENIERTIA